MYYMGDNLITFLLIIIATIIVIAAQIRVSYAYRKYRKFQNKSGITGASVAREILASNGLEHIYVVETKGELTDHYDPKREVIRLSTDIYNGTSIASIAVAAHECGHAIQKKKGYVFMKIRTFLVPFVNLISYLGYFGIMIGLFFGMTAYLNIGIMVLAASLLFQLVTLPVEFDASSRAKLELKRLNMVSGDEILGVSSMLRAAAMTYVASLASTILNLLRLILLRGDDD